MSFPKTNFGTCEYQAHKGPDYPSESPNLKTDADIVRGDGGDGYELIEFEGKFICRPCKRRILNDRESIESARKHTEEEKFRASAGFTRS